MHKLILETPSRPTIRRVAEVGAAAAVTVAHEVVGWLLLVFAVLIVAVAGPRKRSRVFAVLFAVAIVLVVLTSWSQPAAAASTPAPAAAEGPDFENWLVAAGLGAIVLLFLVGSATFVAAARVVAAAIAAMMHGFAFAVSAITLLVIAIAVFNWTV